jgi:hypothetical protein
MSLTTHPISERERKALDIVAHSALTRKGHLWIVPSQSGSKKYTVDPDPEFPRCTCPDFEFRQVRCKHLFAVTFTDQRNARMRLIEATRGRWFAAEFVTNEGTLQRIVCRYGVKKGLRRIWRSKNDPYQTGTIIVWDTAIRRFRIVTLSSLTSLRCGNLVWHGPSIQN